MADKVADLYGELGLNIDVAAFERADRLLRGLVSGLKGLAIFQTAKHLTEMVYGVAELGEQATHLSEETGLSTTRVQELGYAAKVVGVETEQLAKAFIRLEAGVATFAQTGKGKVGPALEHIGITGAQMQATLKDPDALLGQIAEKFKAMPDGAGKAQAAVDTFGKLLGPRLIPLLNQGAAGLEKLKKEAHDFGYVLDKETTEKSVELEQNTRRLDAAWQGLKNTAVTAVLPALNEMILGFTAWLAANRELVTGILEGLLLALKTMGTALGYILDGVSATVDIVKQFIAVSTGAEKAIVGIGGAFALVFAKFGFWGVLIGAIGVAIVELIKHWDDVKRGVSDALSWVLDKLVATRDAIVDFFEGAFDAIENLPVVQQLIQLVEGINGVIARWSKGDATFQAAAQETDEQAIANGHGALHAISKLYEPDQQASPPAGQPANAGSPVVAGGGSVNIENHIEIHTDSTDPNKHAQIVADHVDGMLRDAHAAYNGGKP